MLEATIPSTPIPEVAAAPDPGQRRARPSGVPGGVLGAKGLLPGDAARLRDWSEVAAAERHQDAGALGLWCFARPVGGLMQAQVGAVTMWLLGELYRPDSRTDTALMARLCARYRREGHGFVFDLEGQFALLLWDAERRELALFRDGSSAQTLYYAERPDGSLLFSDRLELLVSCPLLARRLSRPSLHEYLRFLDVSTPNTIYEGIVSTEPERLYLHGRHGLHVRDAPADDPAEKADKRKWTLDEAASELDRRLEAAVAERLARSGETVVFLSGGVDSAYLCALAAALAPGRVTALTVGFDEPEADESAVARRIAQHLGVRHEVLRYDLDTYRDAFDRLYAQAEYPFADPAAIPTLLAFEHARGIGDVALDGTGADTLLGVMPARHQRLAVAYGALMPYPVRVFLSRLMAMIPVVEAYRPLVDFGDPEEVLIRWRGFARREIEVLCGEPVSLEHTRYYRIFRNYPRHAHFARYSALLANLPDDRLHVAHAVTGLRPRCPFFSREVAAFVSKQPRPFRWTSGESKALLKAALSGRVPRTLWDVCKHGFDFQFTPLLRDRACELLQAPFHPNSAQPKHCWGNGSHAAELVSRFQAGEAAVAFRLWALVVLSCWARLH